MQFKSVVLFAVGLGLAIGIALVVAIGLLRHFAGQPSPYPPPSPLAATRAPYTGPKLQVHGPQDLKEWRAAEDAVLNSYAWVDPDKGIVRIPIDRAIDLLAERGLPKKIDVGGVKQ
jgi:hypothetical protein